MTRTEALARIRSARESAGITQSAAAREAGISQGVWAKAEAGVGSVGPDTIVRMAAAVGLKLRYVPEQFRQAR